MNSKWKYVERRLKGVSNQQVVTLGGRLVNDYAEQEAFGGAVDQLAEALRLEHAERRISEVTRRELARGLDRLVFCGLAGNRSVLKLLELVVPALDLSRGFLVEATLADEIVRHVERNSDWECEYLFERIDAYSWSDSRFLRLLEESCHPLSRTGQEQAAWMETINAHYDPKTIRELRGGSRLLRQRMDFLLLLGLRNRVVIEVDGRQHYADEEGKASPERYAATMAEDRRLRLAGYELYRFGGKELQPPDGERLVQDFFHGLFGKYEVP